MSLGQIVYYDYEHCREFLEQRAADLRQTAQGIESLALYRELYLSFAYEALEKGALTLGQFDTGLVFLFIPTGLTAADYPQGHEVVRKKAFELMQSTEPPLVMDLLASQQRKPAMNERGRIEGWMRPEFLADVLLTGKVSIQMIFDGGAFFTEVMKPQLEQLQFTLVDSYLKSAQSGELRLRHAALPGKVYKLPWMTWVREMMGGGYSIVYLMACFATYVQKLQAAVEPGPVA